MFGIFMNSISRKIQFGYYLLIIIGIISSILMWYNVNMVRTRLSKQEASSQIYEAVLEMRRQEKNWLLFRDDEAFDTNQRLIGRIKELIATYRNEFQTLGLSSALNDLSTQLLEYEKDIQELAYESGQADDFKLQIVRQLGRDIENDTRQLTTKELSEIYQTLDYIHFTTLMWLMLMFFVALFLGQQLSTVIMKPLQEIVDYTTKIARGDFTSYTPKHRVLELNAVVDALNVMKRELKKWEEQVIQSKKLASLGTLIAGVAHELNNPISNISTSAQILMEELQDAKPDSEGAFCREMIGQMLSELDRARRVIFSLREFARATDVRFEPLQLSVFLETAVQLVRGAVPTGVNLEVSVIQDGLFQGDKQRLQQVVVNLLMNALQAVGDEGEICIEARVDSVANRVVIQVMDNGPGIPDDIKEHIFDPFFTTKDVGEGSGLGLSIVYEIIKKHGGDITVESSPGMGANFIIKLPLGLSKEENGNG